MSPSENEDKAQERGPRITLEAGDRWEIWSMAAMVLVAAMVVIGALILLRLGPPSVYAHGLALPVVGFLTVPLMFWGLMRTIFHPPAIRRSRTIAFLSLVVLGYLGNVPVMAPPLSTVDWKASRPYSLPFAGEGTTLAGGEEDGRNYHSTTATYRWGYDFGFLGAEGKRYRLDGARNEDFECWERDVLAPIAGKVVIAEDGIDDNASPGEVNDRQPLGNHVVIKAGEGEYVYLAHLRRASIAVKPGQEIELGAKVASCGNSGRSIEPHIHVHAQNSSDFPYSESLPLRFGCVTGPEGERRGHMPVGASHWEEHDGEVVANCR